MDKAKNEDKLDLLFSVYTELEKRLKVKSDNKNEKQHKKNKKLLKQIQLSWDK